MEKFTADQIATACADADLTDAQCESLLCSPHYTVPAAGVQGEYDRGRLDGMKWCDENWDKPAATHPANGAQAGLSEVTISLAAYDVLAERGRQMVGEGFSTARDDGYTNNELAHAAATYAYPALHSVKGLKVWPWGETWFKVRDHRRNMIKAGALILAEIERLDRAAPQKKEG